MQPPEEPGIRLYCERRTIHLSLRRVARPVAEWPIRTTVPAAVAEERVDSECACQTVEDAVGRIMTRNSCLSPTPSRTRTKGFSLGSLVKVVGSGRGKAAA
jgi:hypothetical protein